MFMLAIGLAPLRAHLLALFEQMLRYFLEHVLEHEVGVQLGTLARGSVGHSLLPARHDQRLELGAERPMALLGPFAELDQMLLEPLDGTAERPVLLIVLGAIARRIVARGMCGRAVGHELDQGRSGAGARALCRPFSDRMHREEIVAVDTDAGDAVSRTTGRERALLPARITLERGDRPLVVDDVENRR